MRGAGENDEGDREDEPHLENVRLQVSREAAPAFERTPRAA
jgi:hypothetical protein